LGELVKCKTSKIYPTTKNSCQARHIRPLAEFHRLWPDMSGPQARHVWPLFRIQVLETWPGHVHPPTQTGPTSQPYLGLTKPIRLLGRVPEAFPERFAGHVSMTKSRAGHIRSPSQFPERFPGHVRPPTRTCPGF
jgi:hypothetical protein